MKIEANVRVKSNLGDIYLVKRLGDLKPDKYMVVSDPEIVGWRSDEQGGVYFIRYEGYHSYHTWRDAFLKYREKVHELLDETFLKLNEEAENDN